MWERLVLVCCVCVAFAHTQLFSQVDPLDGLLTGFYGSNCEDQLRTIAQEHDLKFVYERDVLFGKFGDLRLNGLSVRQGLDVICAWTKTHWERQDTRTIKILPGPLPSADGQSASTPMVRSEGGMPRPRSAPVARQLATPPPAAAPERSDITVSGWVRDVASGENLPFANVGVRGMAIGASTNVDGRFTLLHVPNDTCLLQVSFIGYNNGSFRLSPGTELGTVVIELALAATNLREFEVVADKVEAVKVTEEPSMMRLTPAKVAVLPNLGEKDIFRGFQLLPGVSAANENSSGLYVRGGTPDQTLVLYDGFTVYNVEHLFGFFSAFNGSAVKDVRLYKGGFEAKYGGRVSGVADITGKDGNSKEFKLNMDISLLSVNLSTEIPIDKKSTLLVAARKSWKSPIYKKIFEQYTEEQTTGGRFGSQSSSVASFFYDVNAKYTYRPNDRDVFSLSFYNGQDNMDNSLEPQAPQGFGGGGGGFGITIVDKTNWGNTGASAKWSRQWNSKLYSNTLLSTSNYFSTRDRGASGSFGENAINNTTNEDNDLKDVSLRTDHEWKLDQHQRIEFGGQVTYNDINYRYAQNDSTILARGGSGSTVSIYLQDRIHLIKNKLMLLPGMRYNYYSGTGKFYQEPRAQLSYQLTKDIKLKGVTGVYNQFAKRVTRESVLENSRDFWLLADGEKLPVTRAVHYMGGFGVQRGSWVFDAEAYYKELTGLSEYSLRFAANPFRIDYSENFFAGRGYARGIDLLLQRNGKHFTGWVGYTLGQVRQQYDVYGVNWFSASNDVTHEFKIVGMWSRKRWDLSATWVYATGKPYTAPKGGYQLTLLDGTTEDFLTVTTKNGRRLPDYHRLDISATYNFFNAAGRKKGSLAFSVFNAYGRKNVWYRNYEIVDGYVSETDVTYFGFTPNLTLNWIIR